MFVESLCDYRIHSSRTYSSHKKNEILIEPNKGMNKYEANWAGEYLVNNDDGETGRAKHTSENKENQFILFTLTQRLADFKLEYIQRCH